MNDAPERTARLMAEGATTFEPLLARWIPARVLTEEVSDGFDYLVARDSLLDPDTLAGRYQMVSALVDDALAVPGRRYLGRRKVEPPRRLPPERVAARYDTRHVVAAFATEERSVPLAAIADHLVAAVEGTAAIELVTGLAVERACRQGERIALHHADDEIGAFDHVVNATWSDRLRLDASLGDASRRAHLFRLKLAVHTTVTPGVLPTATMVLGPYGDVVAMPDGTAYLSWYPTGCIARSAELAPPADWLTPLAPAEAARLADETVAELAARIPQVALVADTPRTIEGGIIFSWGASDVDDPNSELHARYEVGPTTHGGNWHSVDTGKYTLAPLFARRLAERIALR